MAVALLCLGACSAGAAAVDADAAASLRAKYERLKNGLDHSRFHQPLYLDSSETAESVAGDIYARIDYPFAAVRAALKNPGDWCDILILHINTKYCRAAAGREGAVLDVSIGTKGDQALKDAYRMDFAYRVAAQTPSYLQVGLTAEQGPFATRDYRIVLEAVPLEAETTFMHLSYAFSYGLAGRLALQAYLATIGRGKVGFGVAGTESDGKPVYLGGIRGLAERNTMRYYLAIGAFLGAVPAAPQERLEKRLRDWFAASERYPRQLHEMEQDQYLVMKRKEYRRQQSERQAPPA